MWKSIKRALTNIRKFLKEIDNETDLLIKNVFSVSSSKPVLCTSAPTSFIGSFKSPTEIPDPKIGDWCFNIEDNDSYVYTGEKWLKLVYPPIEVQEFVDAQQTLESLFGSRPWELEFLIDDVVRIFTKRLPLEDTSCYYRYTNDIASVDTMGELPTQESMRGRIFIDRIRRVREVGKYYYFKDSQWRELRFKTPTNIISYLITSDINFLNEANLYYQIYSNKRSLPIL